ncbi:hypothetical protein [Rhodohalobacter barkolensis]|uniref:Uncharacterized protein n=1 Tax=Rhodohalobacter barkolensis TaxID=2053187 RepID=A0A2N0VFG1_9BACT|nr:hypothetical protein [Rhodohalobacter barkolensis]PKD42915.1 hypothetical protein CWD77_12745 [Rhodohalobacter barkolensis]
MKGFLIKQTLLTVFGFAALCLITTSCSDTSTSVLPIEDELKQLDIIERVSVRTDNSITTYNSGEDYSLTEVNDGYLLLKFDRNVTIHSFNLVNAREKSIQHDRNSVILYY